MANSKDSSNPGTKRAYIYPWSKRGHQQSYNPYLIDFMDSMTHTIYFVNREFPSGCGILNLIKYLNAIDLIFFNWVEDLPDRLGGIAQVFLLFFLLMFFRAKNIHVIWTVHNKFSHESRNLFIKKNIFRMMLRFSDLIITHSAEGVAFIKENSFQAAKKAIYLPHPVTIREYPTRSKKKYDIFIWGAMHPYKGILEFVTYCSEHPGARNIKVLIAGKFTDKKYYSRVSRHKSANTEIINSFIDKAQIAEYTSLSRYVLFPYSGKCVLSSGALMDSVGMLANIIGPQKGAFADLADLGIISVYDKFSDILDILREGDDFNKMRRQQLAAFANNNNWDKFGKTILELIKKIS